ncbi:MAG: hypothetical protein NVSMB32_01250 [Actinomycetota bacterium]
MTAPSALPSLPALPLWYGPYLGAALLVVAAGAVKVRSPGPTAAVLTQAGLKVGPALARCGAGGELALGVWALTSSRLAAAGLALSYLAFAIFVGLARRAGSPVSSCGCFGRADVAPGTTHVILNLSAAALCAWAASRLHPGVIEALGQQPLTALGVVLVGATTAYLTYLVMTALPRITAGAGP